MKIKNNQEKSKYPDAKREFYSVTDKNYQKNFKKKQIKTTKKTSKKNR